MISRRRESVRLLTVRALDEFARIKEYHKLLALAVRDESGNSDLLLRCYEELSAPHWQELTEALSSLESRISELPMS